MRNNPPTRRQLKLRWCTGFTSGAGAMLGRHQMARDEFKLAIRHEQDELEPDLPHMVQCHTRLVEIGEVQGAAYLIHLHRGIGMLLLARQRADDFREDQRGPVERRPDSS
jgi:hypothetical protein